MRRRLLAVLGWLIVWQLIALLAHNSIVLAGPWETLCALWSLLGEATFWRSLLQTGLRVLGGLFCGGSLGVILAYFAWKRPWVRSILQPPLLAMKAAPVASFVLLLLIWGGNAALSFFVSLLVVLPVVYLNTLAGFDGCDKNLLELGSVFRFSRFRTWRYLYYYALYPSWKSALQLAAGMAWKSGIAAEVIGQPLDTIGNGLYRSKIYLDTAGVLAWTLTAVLLALLLEKLLLRLFDLLKQERRPSPGGDAAPQFLPAIPPLTLRAEGLCKAFGEKSVLCGLDFSMQNGEFWLIRGPSGSGKTTLLRLIMGLETPDSGTLTDSRSRTVSAVFQEDRLLADASALQNVRIADPAVSDAAIWADLQELLGETPPGQPVSAFSGGMRRRVALVRACLSDSDILMLDEPFTGLDETSRAKAIDYLRRRANGRLVLIAAHDNEALEFCQTIDLEGVSHGI